MYDFLRKAVRGIAGAIHGRIVGPKRNQVRGAAKFSLETLECRRVFECSAEGYALTWNWLDDVATTTEGSVPVPVRVMDNDLAQGAVGWQTRLDSVTQGVKGGEVTISLDREKVLYAPAPGFAGSDCFTYTLDDGTSATVNMIVSPGVNLGSDWYSYYLQPTAETRILDVLSNDIFPANYTGAKRITAVTAYVDESSLSIAADGKSVQYHPSNNQAGVYGFSYRVDDRYEGYVTLSLNSLSNPDAFTVNANGNANRLDVLANDLFDAPDLAAYLGNADITSVNTHGTAGAVTINPDKKGISFVPAAGFSGIDFFTYTVDGMHDATVQVNVVQRARNDLFYVAPDSLENTLKVLLNDRLSAATGTPSRVTAVTPGSEGGDTAMAADGQSIIYTPATGFRGVETIRYTLDGNFVAEVAIHVGTSRNNNLPQFESLDELRQVLRTEAVDRYQELFGRPVLELIPGGHWWQSGDHRTTFFNTAEVTGANTDGTPTNNQVAGVEEGDIVESDGEHLYILRSQELIIAKVSPADDMQILSRRNLAGTGSAMYLAGNRLTVVTADSGWFGVQPWQPNPWIVGVMPVFPGLGGPTLAPDLLWDPRLGIPGSPRDPSVEVAVFDVSDPGSLNVIQATRLDGNYQDSRVVDGHLFVTLNGKELVLPQPQAVKGENGVDRYETQAEYLTRMELDFGQILENLLPEYTSYDQDGNAIRAGVLSTAEDIFKPVATQARNMLSIVSLDITGASTGIVDSSTVVGSAGSKIYGSVDNLYVFDQGWTSSDAFTTITKFHWNGETGQIEFVARGSVTGSLNDQFSSDEHEGHLRIATTTRNFVDETEPNRTGVINDLWVLREDQGVMELVGAARNLAPGETIQSARFAGDRGFLVTFEQIDPLFSLDLSDPSDPRVVGELKIPGFSSYIQLLDETHLVGIGPAGVGAGTQIILFDVSNMAAPAVIDRYELGSDWSFSLAQDDSHAFGWYPESNTLAVPFSHGSFQGNAENQLLVFDVNLETTFPSGNGLTLRGQVTSSGSSFLRTSVIEDVIYGIAEDHIISLDLHSPVGQIDILDFGQPEPNNEIRIPALQTATPRDDASFGPAILQAQASLAASMNIAQGELSFITAETKNSGFDLVFRRGERHYFVSTQRDGSIVSVDDDFAFMPANETLDWHNELMHEDVNGDGVVGPLDALMVINELSAKGGRALSESTSLRNIQNTELRAKPKRIDVDNNGYLAPLDALKIINALSNNSEHNRAPAGIVVEAALKSRIPLRKITQGV